MTLTQLRKELKARGFNVRTKSYSHGPHAEYFRLSDKKTLPSVFYGREHLEEWQELLSFLGEIQHDLIELKKAEGIYGLIESKVTA